MPCYHPMHGFRSRELTKNGKRAIVFDVKDGYVDRPVTVSCGRCIGCRLERSRQWAIRCVHEASCYEDNSFITLTYDNEHLPADRSLDVREFQLFMKRFRKMFSKKKYDFFIAVNMGKRPSRIIGLRGPIIMRVFLDLILRIGSYGKREMV